ncbi:hypothetical protein MOQ_006419 [Trypanosoma cruzi marinkellei]|uniref:Uncharacterized protein n=1 Tax=Trypanosoma cruzi marinkellei TaxID=85056 RepID=K2MRT8_TRYCR|nr:hypothetical protein MOQ_006419 [Trypanosoma cruzi marinkellei]
MGNRGVDEEEVRNMSRTKRDKTKGVFADAQPPIKRPRSPHCDDDVDHKKEKEEGKGGVREIKKHCHEGVDVDICHGSFIVADLPSNMATIYTRTVRHLLPEHKKHISDAGIMEEAGGATLTFEVPSKAIAAAMFKRLQNAKVYGRRWKVQYYPLSAVQCAKQACLVDVRLVPAAPRALALFALGGVQGFLALVDANENNDADTHFARLSTGKMTTTKITTTTKPTSLNKNTTVGTNEPRDVRRRSKEKSTRKQMNHEIQSSDDEDHDIGASEMPFAATTPMEGSDVVEFVVASFVDEGSALHARAVLSGRLIGTSGVRMFLERHR